MMIFGIAMTAGLVGQLIAPYSHERLTTVVLGLTAITICVTFLATWRIENGLVSIQKAQEPSTALMNELRDVWTHNETRKFTIFVFLSMTAYFMQELILEPYAGLVFGYTPSQTTSLSGLQNAGVFCGMLSVGILASGLKIGTMRAWVQLGCVGSAFMLTAIMALGQIPLTIPLEFAVVGLGVFNGMFAVAAIGSMMTLAGNGKKEREGTRMGLWGAAQAIAAGFGGLIGTVLADVMRLSGLGTANSYGAVFTFEAALFVWAALIASSSIINRTHKISDLPLTGRLENV
jgi:BCD family chlorophyll transporter-like MFS transporter